MIHGLQRNDHLYGDIEVISQILIIVDLVKAALSSSLIHNQVLFVSQVEVIGGADKYQAVCRKCYGDLMVNKENSAPFRNETPQQTLVGKHMDSGIPRKLFSSLQL